MFSSLHLTAIHLHPMVAVLAWTTMTQGEKEESPEYEISPRRMTDW